MVRPKGEILRYLFRIKVLLGGSFEIFRQVTSCFLYASSPGKRTLRQVQAVDNYTLLLVTWRGKSFKLELKKLWLSNCSRLIRFFNHDLIRGKDNKAYILQVGSVKIPVYCHMTGVGLGACGGGGWTLVMKTDGTKV